MCKRVSCCFSAAALSIAVALLGCQSATSDAKDKQYDVKATVTAVDAAKKTVTLDHEAIPGLMQAMEMEFAVESAQTVQGIQVGDQVQGKLSVKSGENTITRLEKR